MMLSEIPGILQVIFTMAIYNCFNECSNEFSSLISYGRLIMSDINKEQQQQQEEGSAKEESETRDETDEKSMIEQQHLSFDSRGQPRKIMFNPPTKAFPSEERFTRAPVNKRDEEKKLGMDSSDG